VRAATFAAVFAAMIAAHHVGDYWVQTGSQAQRKGLAGWPGRIACAAHVLTYTATLAAAVLLAAWWLAMPLSPWWLCAGLGVSAVSHYFADRRVPLRRLVSALGNVGFWDAGEGLATGAALLDQAWHWGWLFVSALIVSGRPR
jgi:hypothetical protein